MPRPDVVFDLPTQPVENQQDVSSPLMPKPTKRKSMLIRRQHSTMALATELSTSAKIETHQNTDSPVQPSPRGTPPGTPTAPPFHLHQSATAFVATQSSPTSLPEELLELIREFRVRTERVASSFTGGDTSHIQQLHHSGNDIIRSVTNFLIQKHEEEVRYEQRKLMGWAAATKQGKHDEFVNHGIPVDPSIIGPFVLTTLHGILESLLHKFKCDRARIFLPDGPHLRSAVTVGGGDIVAPVRADWERVAGTAFRVGIGINVGDTSKAPLQYSCSADDERHGYHVRNILCLPLITNSDDEHPTHDTENRSIPRVWGVLELVNKCKSVVFANGFTEEDEESASHFAELIASLLSWARPVDLCSNTALEEGAKIQGLVISQRHFGSYLRTLSTAGAHQITRTEASQLIRKQQRKESAVESMLNSKLSVDHPFLRAAERLHAKSEALIYRIACKPKQQSSEPSSYISNEAHSLIQRNGNVRELVQMLEQLDSSWKASRQQCVALESKVLSLEAALRCERGNTRALQQLCVSCGITPPLSQSAQPQSIRDYGSGDTDLNMTEQIESIAPALVENGQVATTIFELHRSLKERLKFSSSKAANLGRRMEQTARTDAASVHHPRPPNRTSRGDLGTLDALIQQLQSPKTKK
jgi:hypothetical protein